MAVVYIFQLICGTGPSYDLNDMSQISNCYAVVLYVAIQTHSAFQCSDVKLVMFCFFSKTGQIVSKKTLDEDWLCPEDLDLMTRVTLASMAGPRQVRGSCQACDSEAGALTAGC